MGAELSPRRAPTALWGQAALLVLAAAGLAAQSRLMGEEPVATAAILTLAGLIWMCLPGRVSGAPLGFVLAVGLAMRAVLYAADPVLENDYLRYLWDGAAVSAGLNPFAVAPAPAALGQAGPAWQGLAEASGGIAGAIGYGHLASIYPPVAQAVFWLAHQLDPWGLAGLRAVMLCAELAGVALLALLLDHFGRPRGWIAIYWWNPLVAKELANAAHMDAILVPFLLGAVLAALRERAALTGALLGLAAGVKLWPLVLTPLLLAPLLRAGRWRAAALALATLALVCAAMLWPVLAARAGAQSGFAAYSLGWERNDAAFGLLRAGLGALTGELGLTRIDPGRLARLAVAAMVGGAALALAWRLRGPRGLVRGALAVAALLLLLSPTVYPWYYAWVLPLLCLWPLRGLMLLGALLPLYYLRFAFVAAGEAPIFDDWIVWVEFAPVVLLLAWDGWQARKAGSWS